MILKSFEIENNIKNIINFKFILIYGENIGLIEDLKKRIVSANKGAEIINLYQEDVVMKIIWKKQDFSKKELFRYGLVTASAEQDIEQIFEANGCFQ